MAVASLAIVAGGGSASAGPVCDSTLHAVSSPSGAGSTALNAVDALTPGNAWAVGTDGDLGFSLHWNGSIWRKATVPVIGAADYLGAVAFAGPHDVWAVGQVTSTTGKGRTLVLHRTTGGWTRVASPNGPSGKTDLYELAMISPTDIWAAGNTGLPGSTRAFVIHWNGLTWKRVAFPTVVSGDNSVQGLAAAGPNDVWVSIQWPTPGGHDHATTFHRAGASWQRFNFPQSGTSSTEPRALLALGHSSVWLAGFTAHSATNTGLLQHWDGTHWVPFNAVDPTANVFFESLAALGPSAVYVFGNYDDGQKEFTLAERFDGINWTRVHTTNPSSTEDRLDAGAAASAGSVQRVWAVGLSVPGTAEQSLVEESCP